jgi:hypothetical protein
VRCLYLEPNKKTDLQELWRAREGRIVCGLFDWIQKHAILCYVALRDGTQDIRFALFGQYTVCV